MITLRLGAHMSIEGAPAHAILRGRHAGCDTIQMFTRSANRWTSRDLMDEEIADFWQTRQSSGVAPIVAHSSYLPNLASPDDTLWQRSIDAVATELERCRLLGITTYVLHPGAHMGSGEAAGLQRVARGLDAVYAQLGDSNTLVALEITAGQGTALGHRLEHLQAIIAQADSAERLAACVDTAHAFAAGYDLRDAAEYEAFWAAFEALLGRERLRAIHLNDAKRPLGSRVDRHEQIGQGTLGIEPFWRLVNDPRLHRVPMLLETPKGPDLLEDMQNLSLLRRQIGAPAPVMDTISAIATEEEPTDEGL